MKKLEITVEQGFDETILSFVSRLAAANGAFDVHDFCWHAEISHQALADGNLDEIARVLEMAGAMPGDSQWRNIKRDGLFFEVNKERIARSNLVRHRLRYCPHCLEEDLASGKGPRAARPYGRASWWVSFLRICRKHEVILVTARPFEQGSSLDFAHMVAAESETDDREKEPEPCRVTSYETYVDGRLWGRISSDGWIDSLPLYVAGRICEYVGATMLFGKRYENAQITDADWIRAADAGYQVVSGGQAAFADFVRGLHREFWSEDMAYLGPLLYGRLYERLTCDNGDPAYDPVRQVVYDVALQDLPSGLGELMFGRVLKLQDHSI